MKKIVHICMSQYSDGWTYQENLLTKYHKKMGYEVILLTSIYCYKEGNLVEDEKTDFYDVNGVRVIRLKNISKINKLPIYLNFLKYLEDLHPDIIFSHGCQYIDSFQVAKYIKNNPNTLLFIDNHADFTNSATNLFSKLFLHGVIWKRCAWAMLPYAQKFWGVLPARVDFLRYLYKLPVEKCDLLVMGADDEKVLQSSNATNNQLLREKLNILDDDFLIVTGGKIDKAKTQTLLLMEAVSNIDNPKVKLLIFGSIEEQLKPKAEKWIDGKKVMYGGWVKPEQSYDYFAIADLVVFPGRHSVFWEQVVGQGKPLLCRKWPGTDHVDIGGNVVFYNEETVEELTRIISKLLEDTNSYEKLKISALTDARDNFLYSNIARKSIELLN